MGGDIAYSAEPPEHVQELEDFTHPASATYIFGNTHYQRPSDHFNCDLLVGVRMDDLEAANHSPFYGNQMAAMIWYDRRLKGSNYDLDRSPWRITQVYDDVTILPDGTKVPRSPDHELKARSVTGGY
jgi:hypothetical protein